MLSERCQQLHDIGSGVKLHDRAKFGLVVTRLGVRKPDNMLVAKLPIGVDLRDCSKPERHNLSSARFRSEKNMSRKLLASIVDELDDLGAPG